MNRLACSNWHGYLHVQYKISLHCLFTVFAVNNVFLSIFSIGEP